MLLLMEMKKMDKSNIFITIYGASGILGILSEIFTNMQTSYIILLVLILLDTFTGISTAIKYKRFSSKGLRKSTKKTITYALCVITIRLLEIILNPLLTTTMLSQIVIAFLAVTESVSILENLNLLGVPIPSTLLPLLIKNLKIPGLNTILENSKDMGKEFSNIDDILNYQIPTFEDGYMRTFLDIKYDAWKSIINQIMLIDETPNNNPDILFYKILSLVELGLKDMKKKWVEEKIPTKYIENFSKNDQAKVDKFLEKLKITCYSEKTIREKKDKIIDCIVIISYQTIIDASKNV
ncbi:MAG: toxin secretion/phage lysis holin [Clostridium sp.]|jgi:toxin secretion/phage lysis holin